MCSKYPVPLPARLLSSCVLMNHQTSSQFIVLAWCNPCICLTPAVTSGEFNLYSC